MEYCTQRVWSMTSVLMAGILTVTSPTAAFLFDPQPSTDSHEQPSPSFMSLSIRSSSLSSTGGVGTETCCENGGMCVIGVFCFCPEQFYGFRCEYEKQMRPCGPVEHMQWARLGCNLCRCFDSNLTCMSHIYSGCDNKPAKEVVDVTEYKDDMQLFPMDKKSSASASTYGTIYSDSYYYDYSEGNIREDEGDEIYGKDESRNHSSSSDTTSITSCRLYHLLIPFFVFLYLTGYRR